MPNIPPEVAAVPVGLRVRAEAVLTAAVRIAAAQRLLVEAFTEARPAVDIALAAATVPAATFPVAAPLRTVQA
ncbi:MAG TPA: hypothetical protein VJQ59_07705, partial [Candidatus Sulfotelmatobacter sp.]|nr:hypothetical protein [Candidatus Sulfotelmatobacter sp.]